MSTKENGGPAFPNWEGKHYTDQRPHNGMSLRDYFAAKAMQAIVIGNRADQCVMGAGCAADAYQLADAMLAARDSAGNAG